MYLNNCTRTLNTDCWIIIEPRLHMSVTRLRVYHVMCWPSINAQKCNISPKSFSLHNDVTRRKNKPPAPVCFYKSNAPKGVRWCWWWSAAKWRASSVSRVQKKIAETPQWCQCSILGDDLGEGNLTGSLYFSAHVDKPSQAAHSRCKGRVGLNIPRSISPRMSPVCRRWEDRPTTMSSECLWRHKSRVAVAARRGSSWTSLSGTRLDAMLETCSWIWCHWKKPDSAFFLLPGDDSWCAGIQPLIGECEEIESVTTRGGVVVPLAF